MKIHVAYNGIKKYKDKYDTIKWGDVAQSDLWEKPRDLSKVLPCYKSKSDECCGNGNCKETKNAKEKES